MIHLSQAQPIVAVLETYKTDSTDDQNSNESIYQIATRKDGTKYKTQICKNYSELGYCPYKTKCQFAHGQSDLLKAQLQNRRAYRTKKCKSFWENNYCRYGFRCQFLHYKANDEHGKKYLQIIQSMFVPTQQRQNSRLLTLLFSSKN